MRMSAGGRPALRLIGLVAAVIGGSAACARMLPPPGGPPDNAPPRLLSVTPASGSVMPRFDGKVDFRFDEVVSEGAATQGAGSLQRQFIVSPTTIAPKVRWHRDRISVEPAEGWQSNRVYRVQLLPGITDLRNNRSDSGAVVTFTTGAPAPTTTITGSVIDWTSRRPVANALVEAVLQPDSLPYRTLADSSGRFIFGPLPSGTYIVYGVIDQNRDFSRGLREAYDTARLAPGDTAVGELWAFVHDSTPPRIQSVTANDSVSATITFAQMLDPQQRFDTSAVRLRRLPDSTVVAVTSLLPQPIDDSLQRAQEPADTARADTLPAPPPRPRPVPRPQGPAEQTGRPQLYDRLILRVPTPWQPDERYLLEIRGVRTVSGITGNVQNLLVVPKAKPALPDSLRVPIPPPPNEP